MKSSRHGGVKGGRGEGIVWTEERDKKHWSANSMILKSKRPKFETVGMAAPSERTGLLSSPNVGIEGTAGQFVQYALTKARIDQWLENIREELGRGRESEVDMSEVLLDKANINKLSQWLMKGRGE